MTRSVLTDAVTTITSRMARGDKPYRVYRGGRAKGRVPLQRRADPPPRPGTRQKPVRQVSAQPPVRRRRPRWGRRITLVLGLLVLVLVAWEIGRASGRERVEISGGAVS